MGKIEIDEVTDILDKIEDILIRSLLPTVATFCKDESLEERKQYARNIIAKVGLRCAFPGAISDKKLTDNINKGHESKK